LSHLKNHLITEPVFLKLVGDDGFEPPATTL
jgi:hypothetical protein